MRIEVCMGEVSGVYGRGLRGAWVRVGGCKGEV